MAYGFKLTGITIPDGTTVINAVISDGTTPSEYTLRGSVADSFSGTGISATCTADDDVYDVDINVNALTSEDVGDEYTINLSLPEEPTQAFSEAVGMATEPLKLHDAPLEFQSLIETALTSALPDVLAAQGKFCIMPTVSWNYSDAEDKAAYEDFENEIINIARHREIPAFYGTIALTDRYEDMSKCRVGGLNYSFSALGYNFIFSFTFFAFTLARNRHLEYEVIAAAVTTIS